MIRVQHHPEQLRIDTQIKLIDKDGTETIASVLVLVNLSHVNEKQQYNIYKIANSVFNRDFTIDKRIKATSPNKPWYKFW
jgi:hypothetical protein